jgi:hypothetical protein
LAARLTQLDSEIGNLTLAKVRFELYKFNNSTTTPDFIFGNIAVDATGNAQTTVALAVNDAYTVRVVIEPANGYWTANPAGEGHAGRRLRHDRAARDRRRLGAGCGDGQ